MREQDDLFAAYRATAFWVEDAAYGSFSIHDGKPSEQLDHLLRVQGFSEWAYITPCNPGSRQLSDSENVERMRQFTEQLRQLGFRFYHGKGVGTIGSWPPEPSLLVLGITEPEAVRLARQFDQEAILLGRIGEPARLLRTSPSAAQGEMRE